MIRRTTSYAVDRQQISLQQDLDQEKLYTIECKVNGFLLRQQLKTYKLLQNDNVRIIGNQLQAKTIDQLWMFKKIQKTDYEIVHVKTDLVLTIDQYEAKLEPGRRKPNQLFEIMPYKSGFCRIKDYTGCVLYLDGILESNDYNERDDSQLFRLKGNGAFQIAWMKDTFFILTMDKILSMDLVNASRLNQVDIILFEKNLRMNQRWRIEAVGKEPQKEGIMLVYIKSALTNLYITYNMEKDSLTQAAYSQEWRILQTNQANYVYLQYVKSNKYLSYDQDNKIQLSKTKKIWFLQNGYEMLKQTKLKLQKK